MRKWICAVMAFALIVVGFAASSPTNTASATTSWPITIDNISADTVEVYSNGAMQLSGCRGDLPNEIASLYLDAEGVARNTMQGPGSTNDKRCFGTGGAGLGYGAEDGTLYGMRMSTSDTSSELVAWKNDRELWTTVTTSPSNCMYSNGTSKAMWPTTISEGSDGNIYMVLIGNILPLACDDRLFGVNPKTGAIVVDEPIGTASSNGQGLRYAKPTAWTLNDAIIVVDRKGYVREFSYAGVENASQAKQLPTSGGYRIDNLAVNSEGTVFALAYGSEATSPTMLYQKRNGASNAIPNTAGSIYPMFIEPTSDGNFIGVQYTGGAPRFDKFNLATNNVAVTNPSPLTPNYSSNTITAYSEDAEGNRLTMWSQSGSGTKATSVDLYDASSNTSSTVFLKEMKTSDLTNYPNFQTMSDGSLRNAVGGGNLYVSICEHSPSSCYSSSGTPDISIYKVDVGDFGTPLGKGFKRNSYENDKLEYVAMGDSFSSGEGNPSFIPGTDTDDLNECHRSAKAYPLLLDEDSRLNLTAFVACSGATVDTVKNGGEGMGSWSEGSQLDALSMSTDVVTISIGGNDIGFAGIIEGCADSNLTPAGMTQEAYCEELRAEALLKIESPDFEDALQLLFLDIETKVRNDTKILVVGYPVLVPTNPVPCTWGPSYLEVSTVPRPITMDERSDLYDLTLALNQKIDDATLGLQAEYIDSVDTFWGKAVCQTDSYINEISWPNNPEYSFHPNEAGHAEYKSILETKVD